MTEYQFIDSTGVVRLDGTLDPDPAGGEVPIGPAGGDLAGTYPDPTIGTGKVVAAKLGTGAVTTAKILDANVTLAKLAVNFPYVSTAAAAPTTFTTPIYYDSTAVTGGLYAWNGTAYIQIGGLIA